MTIRKKIWWIYVISVLLPGILLTASLLISTKIVRLHIDDQVQSMEKAYINEPLDNIINSIQIEVDKNPAILENESYINLLASTLQMTPFELRVFKDDEAIIMIEKKEIEGTQPLRIIREGQFKVNGTTTYRYVVPIRLREGKPNGRLNKSLIDNALMFLAVYILIHFIFFKYSIKTIFGPLENMKEAALRIRDENYDEPLVYDGNDEVGEVFTAFEEMRLRIQDSHLIQNQYEDNRKELIANISHDLKTPITAINGYVQGILDGVANTEDKLQSYIETIAVYSRDMDTLIDDLSLLSKLDIDGIQFDFKEVPLVSYIDDCMEEIAFDLEEKGISVEKHFDLSSEIKAKIDGAQIKRVLNNIIFNAAKHFDKEESILKIQVYDNEDYCSIAISDNGCGIEGDKLDNVFERFYRADASRNSQTGGSGLGLSIARKIVHAHGGDIKADSEVGKGTSITFTVEKIKEI